MRIQTSSSLHIAAAIRTDNLTKQYGSRACVDDLSFSVPPGSVCGFIGQNGAGKTTTIRLLLGLIRPTSGRGEVLGRSILHPAKYLKKVGAMIEGPAFYPTLSARQNLKALAQVGGIDPTRIDEVLAVVDLTDRADDLFRSFSLGMKQRLGIAAALLPRPELLVLDEPTNGLDPQGIREIRVLLRDLANGGITVFVSSHLLDELQHICDHVILIDKGRLRFAGTIAELLAHQHPTLVVTPEDMADCIAIVELCAKVGVSAFVDGYRVRVDAPQEFAGDLNRTAMAMRITLVELAIERTRLEDVFFSFTEAPGTFVESGRVA
jgi:ABC-2 type transport system ATP-binding protein